MNILDNIDEYISQHLNMSLHEFQAMFNHSNMDNISGPSDVKVALSNAVKANRILSKMRAKIKSMQINKVSIIEQKTYEIREELYKIKKELQLGKCPLSDKELLDKQYNKYLEELKEIETFNKKQKYKKDYKKLPKVMEEPDYISTNVAQYTSIDIKTASETAIKDVAKMAAENIVRSEMQQIMVTKQVVDELLESVRKEIGALGSVASVVSSEQYGMNRLGPLERKEEKYQPSVPKSVIPKQNTPVVDPMHDW